MLFWRSIASTALTLFIVILIGVGVAIAMGQNAWRGPGPLAAFHQLHWASSGPVPAFSTPNAVLPTMAFRLAVTRPGLTGPGGLERIAVLGLAEAAPSTGAARRVACTFASALGASAIVPSFLTPTALFSSWLKVALRIGLAPVAYRPAVVWLRTAVRKRSQP